VATTFVDATGTRALVAYVVPTAGAGPSPDSVRASLAASLPDFMVPARVLVLAALPLSGSGKLDRRALPAPGTQAAGSRAHVPPRSDAERRMVASWEAVLEQHPIGLTDNFFQLGGDSLLAVVLSARLEQELGIELPLSRLLARPTVEGLLASLAEPAAPGRHLVTLTPAAPGSRAPLVLLSGVGGFGFFFQGLAHRLGGAQPVHVLHAVGAEDEREGLEHTIEELAAIYEPQVLAACPSGPVVLGGYSLGALIAFELTRRLVARGREVPLLVSFDGMAPGHPQLVPMPERLLLHLGAFLMRDGSGRRDYLRGRLDRLKGRFQAEAKGDPRLAAIEGPARAMAARLERVAAGLWWARDRYAPTGTVAADVLLLKATEPQEWPGCRSDGRYGWGDATRGRVDVEPVPGRHHGLFNPANNERMARVLAAHLELLAAR
jgi:thioesterase domain-containing protein/acyl carrier protein